MKLRMGWVGLVVGLVVGTTHAAHFDVVIPPGGVDTNVYFNSANLGELHTVSITPAPCNRFDSGPTVTSQDAGVEALGIPNACGSTYQVRLLTATQAWVHITGHIEPSTACNCGTGGGGGGTPPPGGSFDVGVLSRLAWMYFTTPSNGTNLTCCAGSTNDIAVLVMQGTGGAPTAGTVAWTLAPANLSSVTPNNVALSGGNAASKFYAGTNSGTGLLTATASSLHFAEGNGVASVSTNLTVNVVKLNMTAYRPQTETYGHPFQRLAIPDGQKIAPGAGIRVNGEDDNNNGSADRDDTTVNNENDLIEVTLTVAPLPPAGFRYVLKRSNSKIKVWTTQTKQTTLLGANNETNLTFSTMPTTVWVENPNGGAADLELQAKTDSGMVICSDKVHFYPFTSIVIALGGENQVPTDPANANHGMFLVALDLYGRGYDVHMYDEDVVVDETDGGVAFAEVHNAVQNRNVTQVAIFGYSHGGGSTHDLAVNLNANGQAIAFAAYVDAVAQPGAAQENRRPPGIAFFANYYQENGAFELGGGPVPGANFEIDVTTTGWGAALDHFNVDDHQNVRDGMLNHLIGHVSP